MQPHTMVMTLVGDDVAATVDSIVRSLEARLGEAVDVELIRAEVCAELAAFATAPVQQFVPILVESHVRARLQRCTAHRFDPQEGTDGQL